MNNSHKKFGKMAATCCIFKCMAQTYSACRDGARMEQHLLQTKLCSETLKTPDHCISHQSMIKENDHFSFKLFRLQFV